MIAILLKALAHELGSSTSLPNMFILKYGPFILEFPLLAHLSLLSGCHTIYLLGFSIGETWEH
jgi:hypothetical protein